MATGEWIKALREYMGMETREFLEAWKTLSTTDKNDFRIAFVSGDMTY